MSEWSSTDPSLSRFVVLRHAGDDRYERHAVPEAHTVEYFNDGYLFRDKEGRLVAHYSKALVGGFERCDNATLAFSARLAGEAAEDADEPDDSEVKP